MNLNKQNLSIAFFWLVVFISTTKCFAQNFKGGIGDGHASDSIVNVDFNTLPENFTVTITLADGQSNLSNNSPINFKATFNKNTSNFISSDVSFGGTANPSTVLVTGGPLVYNIAVSGMTGSGNVNVTIAAGVCTDNILGSKNAA
jgi:hypothetical protein